MYIISIILSESYVESVQLESQKQAGSQTSGCTFAITVRWWGWKWNCKRGNYKNHLSGTCVRGNIVATTLAIKILLLNWSFLSFDLRYNDRRNSWMWIGGKDGTKRANHSAFLGRGTSGYSVGFRGWFRRLWWIVVKPTKWPAWLPVFRPVLGDYVVITLQ